MLDDMVARLQPSALILDIGSNVGNHTLFLAAAGYRVRSFEPNQDLATAQRESVVRNGFGDHVLVEVCGIGATNSYAAFAVEDHANLGAQKLALGEGDIQVRRLDDMEFDGAVAALKIDVEGMEPEVLKGAAELIARDRPLLYIEAATFESFHQVCAELVPHGYAVEACFNNTPTFLFLPAEDRNRAFSAKVPGTELAEDLFARVTEIGKMSLERQEDQERIENLKVSFEKAKDQHLKKVRELNIRLAGLADELATVRRKQGNEEKRRKKYQRLFIICGFPVLLLLSPILLPVFAVKHLLKPRKPKPAKVGYSAFHKGAVNIEAADEPQRTNPASNRPFVSVIMPNYNNADFIVESVDSALAQEDVELEVIVVDDGSTDASLDILVEKYGDNSKVAIVPLLRNFGCYYTRNIGLVRSTGDYIAFLDSDDVMHPRRLVEQVAAIQDDQRALFSQSKLRRWSADLSEPMTEAKFGENTIVFKREVLRDIGYYDCVRYAGDSEYRERILALFGPHVARRVDKEFYSLRTLGNSLTTGTGSAAYARNDGSELVQELSAPRKTYQQAFRAWHAGAAKNREKLRIEFPQRSRSFALGEGRQNASPMLGEAVTGRMASYPAREHILRNTIGTVISQVDRLELYLNQYEEVPDFLRHDRIDVTLGKDAAGDLRDNGKFYSSGDPSGYLVYFDDDIHYPEDYVARMLHEVENFERKVVVGVHGVIFPEEKRAYTKDRMNFRFTDAHRGRFVDLLGTGTIAYHTDTLSVSLEDFHSTGVCDLWFAVQCHAAGVPMVSIPRGANWLVGDADEISGPSLYLEARNQGASHTSLYHQNLRPILDSGRSRLARQAECVARYGEARLRLHNYNLD
ncbi:FkbM family methyltransferase [Tropicimonas sp. IMCC6043]|uniref:FkbM family methyltransferase n=1 Tax=Tropicimonas sp. IMCC6043 TaxID=2510645 RepID=UPI00101BBA5A|nr:FkbM family methyltransferase [Tropicimonas sp. IMCC6043]RYH05959.1 FkbM family methyltransferase [Tropicimonas sp. IMCC6043]